MSFYPFPKLKAFADEKLNVTQNIKVVFHMIENIERKKANLSFYPFPKLKAFADDKLNVTQNIKVVFHMIENIERKKANAGYQHLRLFPQCFQKDFPSVCQKSSLCDKGLIG